MSGAPLKIYLIAGESSGDLLGSHLMRALKAESPREVKFHGVGGEKMEAEGLSSLFPYHELSLLGFVEILPYVFNIFVRINAAVEDILAKQPDVVVTIDVPGFNLRVAERLRKAGCKAKLVHYVAPTVWAYKPERAALCARLFDHLLVLFPFEPPYFEKEGLACTFIGHPVAAEIAPGDGGAFRKRYDIAPDVPLLCLLPGSRSGEIKRHMPVLGPAVAMLAQLHPNLALAVAVPRHVLPAIAPYFQNCPFRAVVTASEQDKLDAIAAANVAIVKSGTVALEVAAAGTAMLVTYRVNPISARMLRRVMLTRYVNILNIMEKAEIIPELLQEHCNPLMIANSAASLLHDTAMRDRQKQRVRRALDRLVPADGEKPSRIAARTILSLLS